MSTIACRVQPRADDLAGMPRYLQRKILAERRRADEELVDEIAIDIVVSGIRQCVPLTRTEQDEVVRRMRARGVPYDEIAEAVGTTQRSVIRDARRLGLTGG